jgi:hypothetical protein
MTMSTQLGTQVGYDPANFYVWRVSDGFAIHLSLKVVTQLAAQISRAGSDSQPAEIRGILLGRSMDTPYRATVIEDFKLIPPARDPAASAISDDAAFEIARRMIPPGSDQRSLGFFRAGRDGNLNMGPRDRQTFSDLFCETGNIALLIQTPRRGGESDAALFYWQHGAQPRDFGFGFPLDASQLADGHPGWRYPNPLEGTQPAARPWSPRTQVPEQTTPLPPAHSSGVERIRWSRLLPTAALMVICIGALQLATNSNRTVAAAPALTEPGNETRLGLTLTTRPHQLEIRWNRESAAIAACDKGVMRITDNGITEVVPFDQGQLRDGYVAYTPKTNDVSIRLEVTGQDGGATSESIRSVAIP